MFTILLSVFLLPGILTTLLIVRRISQTFRPVATHNGVPRPPLLPNWIPFLGNGLAMCSDRFWKTAYRRYGPVMRMTVMGEERTFVVTSTAINHVYRKSKNFDSYFFRRMIPSVVFGMEYDHAMHPIMDHKLFPDHHRNMQPGVIAKSIRRYADQLEVELGGRLNRAAGRKVDLVDFVFETIYTASTKAFLSSSFPSSTTVKDFRAFDKGFPFLTLQALPSLFRSPAGHCRDKMLTHITKWWKNISEKDRSEIAEAVVSSVEVGEEEGWSDRDNAGLILGELWALEANAPYGAIWTIVEILRHPQLLPILRKEIRAAQSSLSPPTISTLIHLPQPDLVQLLPTINAAFQETLRFHVDTSSPRVVQEDLILPPVLCGGGPGATLGLALKKSEQVICVTRVAAVDVDGDWGPTAGSWDYRRHMKGNEGMKGSMNPFGGGLSMCEGRHFASAEILTFIAMFLSLVDVEVLQDTLEPDIWRVGLGVHQTKGKFKVRINPRDSV